LRLGKRSDKSDEHAQESEHTHHRPKFQGREKPAWDPTREPHDQ